MEKILKMFWCFRVNFKHESTKKFSRTYIVVVKGLLCCLNWNFVFDGC